MRIRWTAAGLLLGLSMLPNAVWGHDGHVHHRTGVTPADRAPAAPASVAAPVAVPASTVVTVPTARPARPASRTLAATPAAGALTPGPGALPFPVPINPAFDLIDHDERTVRFEDLRGRPVLLFFGYASCESICDVALPLMGEVLDRVGPDGEAIQAIMITIDPDRDTPAVMKESLAAVHPRLLGLTGSAERLTEARRAFQVQARAVGPDASGGEIYSHGSFIYVIGADGAVRSMLPPVLSAERMAEIVRGYL